jgi:hypothetical protein
LWEDGKVDKKYYETLGGGIFLIGLGILFLTRWGIWPWILVVIACAQLPVLLAQKQGWAGWQGFLWLVGLAVLFASGHFWPWILIVVGASVLIGAITKDARGSPFGGSPKKEQPAPPEEEAAPDTAESAHDTRKLE